MRKNIITSVIAAGVLGLALTGCGSVVADGATSTAPVAAQPAPVAPVEESYTDDATLAYQYADQVEQAMLIIGAMDTSDPSSIMDAGSEVIAVGYEMRATAEQISDPEVRSIMLLGAEGTVEMGEGMATLDLDRAEAGTAKVERASIRLEALNASYGI